MKFVFLLIFSILTLESCGKKSDPKFQAYKQRLDIAIL